MSATVEITEEGGEYKAVDTVTGATGTGKSRSMALAVLAASLRLEEGTDWDDADAEMELLTRAALTRRRFEEEDVTEDDVDDAIEWARSK